MKIDTFISGLILICAFYVIFFIGKLVNDILHKEYKLDYELVEKDNFALALSLVGYYMGLVLSIGGSLIGQHTGIIDDLLDLCIYGILGIILMNASWYICEKFILYKFNIKDELIRDQNQGTGIVFAGISIASGFIIYGAVQGKGGNIFSVAAFWALGQILLIIAGFIYSKMVPYDVYKELEKDNVAAGISFAGALISVGIIVGLAGESDFESWRKNLSVYFEYAVLGLVLLPIIRLATDKILIPKVNLSDEIAMQERPNVGAAYIEAFSYIAAAFIIYWCI